jgi:hypothetical protein
MIMMIIGMPMSIMYTTQLSDAGESTNSENGP